MVERPGVDLSFRRQCALLNLGAFGGLPAEAGHWRGRSGADAPHRRTAVELPFYGSRRMTFELNKEVRRGQPETRAAADAHIDGDRGAGSRPGTSKPAPGHKIYPYLLRGLAIARPSHVWAADITCIPIARGFLYLVAIIDWASRAR